MPVVIKIIANIHLSKLDTCLLQFNLINRNYYIQRLTHGYMATGSVLVRIG